MFEESNKIVKAEGDFLRKLRDNRIKFKLKIKYAEIAASLKKISPSK